MNHLTNRLCVVLFALTCIFVCTTQANDWQVDVLIGDAQKKGEPLDTPFGVAFDGEGTLYVQEFDGHHTFRAERTASGELKLVRIAGKGAKGYEGDGGPATEAVLNGPHNLAVMPAGDVFIADTWNHAVRRVDGKTGRIETIAGTGEKGFTGDGGPAKKATFNGTFCITLNPSFDKLHIADLGNRRIRAIDLKTGKVDTVAGNGKRGVPEDGAVAKESPLVDPRAVAADSKGNVYVLERSGHALRVVDTRGRIRTVAGKSAKKGKADGDAATSQLNGPKHLCVDSQDRVVIADAENNLIRRYDPATGQLTTLPLGKLARPHGVAVAANGDLYIADSYHHRVLRAREK